MNNFIISVAVENTVYHFDKLFDYFVPEELQKNAKIGCRVLVPFGKGNSKRQGIIFDIKRSNTDTSKLKLIEAVLDKEPLLNDEMISLSKFIKDHYFCTYYDAIKALLPTGISYQAHKLICVSKELGDEVFDLPSNYRTIIKYILSSNNKVTLDKIKSQFPFVDDDLIHKMVDDKVINISDTYLRKTGDKLVKMIRISSDIQDSIDNVKITPKQQLVLDTLLVSGAVSLKELCYYTGVTPSVADSLVKKGIAEYFDDEVFRIPKTIPNTKKEYILTDEQRRAFDVLYNLYNDDKPHAALLYGITGSGKTSVFFKLIEKTIDDNKDVIVMVPEIALTPQLISIFKAEFGEKVAIFHSALSIGERLDEYKRVKKGLAKIVIGTRSAVFAPFNNLGLIIIDEEQEHTYKSESKPRYHAREISKFRCSYNNALLVLSSATPSIETYYYAEIGKYAKVTLNKRYGKAVLPEVITVDMNKEVDKGNITEYSDRLLLELEDNLKDKKQSILLLNRRGHNTYVSCRSCKEPITCPNCSITLTYHSANKKLMCHYCGYSIDVPDECPNCTSTKLRFSGHGTQRAQTDLSEIFPTARILRMDTDSTMNKSSHEKYLTSFGNGEYDILVGTQMVAKGLDFPNVTLVGIINADQMLYSDDYRAYENTFSLLTQVIGRSGRGDNKGKAIIQTHTPNTPIISLSSAQDYIAFYEDEITVRKALLYPPFAELVLVGFVSDNKTLSENAARKFTELLSKILSEEHSNLPIRLLGPSPQTVIKVNNKYRYKLIIKTNNNKEFRDTLSCVLVSFSKEKEFNNVTVYADVGPLEL